jgi:transposase
MQKALDQMNLQLHHVISDITGLTGLAIIDAILAGERDPATLAALRNRRIHASVETVTKSLGGDYRPEHVFRLRQSLGAYRYYQQLVAECDVEIERHLTAIPEARPGVRAPPASFTRRRPRGNKPRFDLRTHLHRIFGVDLTTIPGIDVLTVLRSRVEQGASPPAIRRSHVSDQLSQFPGQSWPATRRGFPPPNSRNLFDAIE